MKQTNQKTVISFHVFIFWLEKFQTHYDNPDNSEKSNYGLEERKMKKQFLKFISPFVFKNSM